MKLASQFEQILIYSLILAGEIEETFLIFSSGEGRGVKPVRRVLHTSVNCRTILNADGLKGF